MSILRKIVRTLFRIIILFLILLFIYAIVPAYPHLIFKHKMSYKNFSVYSDKKLPSDLMEKLDETIFRIEKLEIYDSTFNPDVFICNSKDLYKFFAFWIRINPNSQGFNLSFFDKVISDAIASASKSYSETCSTNSFEL